MELSVQEIIAVLNFIFENDVSHFQECCDDNSVDCEDLMSRMKEYTSYDA